LLELHPALVKRSALHGVVDSSGMAMFFHHDGHGSATNSSLVLLSSIPPSPLLRLSIYREGVGPVWKEIH